MTDERILAICESNWTYRGVDDTSVREMREELRAHLEEAAAAGRSGTDVVGEDVAAFAAAWARERRPLRQRVGYLAGVAGVCLGVALLLAHLTRWTTSLPVTPERIAFYVLFAAVFVAWELRRGGGGHLRTAVIGLVALVPVAVAARWLHGDVTLFHLPLWASAALLLAGAFPAVTDRRRRRESARAGDRSAG
ncbi:hypothetical protein LE181_27790 [Streptomyces sp. SCA3-4]|uniref:hypothetical protein n=1 Tax=Streptomyces sichuanensis TaxID=2871810 RepID=UPI001CE3128E|nr:hypothetical protein [Streptomyces sichuanensis]MCA6095951.1 hypothetical protein [Streptomyces sichuanensis]